MIFPTRRTTTRGERSDQERPGRPRQVRRGTTLMEYLMMLSLIVVAAMIGIGYFGQQTANVTSAASNAISKAVKKGG